MAGLLTFIPAAACVKLNAGNERKRILAAHCIVAFGVFLGSVLAALDPAPKQNAMEL